jgi:hypothetical protein
MIFNIFTNLIFALYSLEAGVQTLVWKCLARIHRKKLNHRHINQNLKFEH